MSILFSEFDAALSDNNGKTEGKDGIQAELLNVLGAKDKVNYMISATRGMCTLWRCRSTPSLPGITFQGFQLIVQVKWKRV